jgi:hypothetical protein
VAHRKIEAGLIWNYDDDDEDDVDREVAKCYPVNFRFDPITVLGSLKDFQIAASCCFKKVAKLKNHLRVDHIVDTKCVQGNDLYERFKVRYATFSLFDDAAALFGSPFYFCHVAFSRFVPLTDCYNAT